MTVRDELKATGVEEQAVSALVPPKKDGWEISMERAEHALEVRRVTRNTRDNKPISFSTPSLWSLSGSDDER